VSAHRDQHLELCAAFVLGCLDEADRLELEAHLRDGCSECEAEIARLSEALPALASVAPSAVPPAALRARVLEAVRAEASPLPERAKVLRLEPRRRRFSYATLAWAAAAVVLAVATVTVWRAYEELRATVGNKETELARLHTQLEEISRWAALLDSPDAKVVDLTLTPAGSALLRARATFDRASGRTIIVFENFTVPAGSDYELWAIRGAGPVSLGLIHPDIAGRAVVKLDRVDDPKAVQAFAVSLERTGGSPNPNAPQGPVVMVGKLGS
jgi:anti-sigma-K factor RskA